jgi:hypothetical protein
MTGFWVLLCVGIGWFNCFVIALLLPMDVEATLVRRCDQHFAEWKNATANAALNGTSSSSSSPVLLPPTCHRGRSLLHLEKAETVQLWNINYWSNFMICWFIAGLMQEYVLSGAFTVGGKVKQSLRNNVIFFAVLGVLFGAFLGYLVLAQSMTGSKLVGFLQGLANVWGLFVLMCLLGYGLVEVPRGLWHKGNPARKMRYYQYRAMLSHEELLDAQVDLSDQVDDFKAIIRGLPPGDKLQKYIDVILQVVPPHFVIERNPGSVRPYDEPITLRLLENIHASIASTDFQVRTAFTRFQRMVDKVSMLEDVERARRQPETKRVVWTYKDSRHTRPQFQALEWYWVTKYQDWASRALAVCCAVLSAIIVWCETTIFKTTPDLSLLSVIVHSNMGRFKIQLLVALFCAYICYCTYATLFKIRLFSYYRLGEKQSDANSLLFNTALLLRLAPAIVYNYLYIIHETRDTAYAAIVGDIDLIPFVGKIYNEYFPIIIGVLCVISLFNLDGRILHLFKVRRFELLQAEGDEHVTEGKNLVEREQERRASGKETDIYGRLLSAGDKDRAGRANRGLQNTRARGDAAGGGAVEMELGKAPGPAGAAGAANAGAPSARPAGRPPTNPMSPGPRDSAQRAVASAKVGVNDSFHSVNLNDSTVGPSQPLTAEQIRAKYSKKPAASQEGTYEPPQAQAPAQTPKKKGGFFSLGD